MLSDQYMGCLTCPLDQSAFSRKGGLSYALNCGVGDIDWQTLSGLHQLSFIGLGRCLLDDDGVRQLPPFQNLKAIDLSDNLIGDQAVAHLTPKRFPRLQECFLDRTDISDNVWENIAAHRELRLLSVSNTRVTGNGLSVLKSSPSLVSLNLRACPIDESGLNELIALRQLQTLNLDRIPLSPEMVARLGAMKNLKLLTLKGCGLSTDQITQLKEMIPDCKTMEWPTANGGSEGIDLRLKFP